MNRGYLRVSTLEQAGQKRGKKRVPRAGVSFQTQQAHIKDYLKGEPVRFYRDIGSGRNGNRKALQKLLAEVEPGDIVLVYKLDRIFRSTLKFYKTLELFRKRKIGFISVSQGIKFGSDSSSTDKLIINILAAVAEWESEIISERTRETMAVARLNGVAIGSTPYGFDRRGKRLVENPQEKEAVQKMKKKRAQGWSFDKIAEWCNSSLIPPKNGKKFYGATINSVLRREEKINGEV